ncbi:uncharacterized protein PSFLO_04719 [Pseudozyma flocculosa]|uniref:WD40 repeat-like protein n=1 Tax=Pseudozyma flocculosa TaxID=84751 RepID=A0A5C3F712_9BASI|nr:uncharacterized protein PSFLO_04719 [Pseudozyma flocculosa]
MSWISSFDPSSSTSLPPAAAAASQRQTSAPSHASLRSEDSQPNEGTRRSRPWELDAPPTIGASRSKIQPRQGQPSSLGRSAASAPRPGPSSSSSSSSSAPPRAQPAASSSSSISRKRPLPEEVRGPHCDFKKGKTPDVGKPAKTHAERGPKKLTEEEAQALKKAKNAARKERKRAKRDAAIASARASAAATSSEPPAATTAVASAAASAATSSAPSAATTPVASAAMVRSPQRPAESTGQTSRNERFSNAAPVTLDEIEKHHEHWDQEKNDFVLSRLRKLQLELGLSQRKAIIKHARRDLLAWHIEHKKAKKRESESQARASTSGNSGNNVAAVGSQVHRALGRADSRASNGAAAATRTAPTTHAPAKPTIPRPVGSASGERQHQAAPNPRTPTAPASSVREPVREAPSEAQKQAAPAAPAAGSASRSSQVAVPRTGTSAASTSTSTEPVLPQSPSRPTASLSASDQLTTVVTPARASASASIVPVVKQEPEAAGDETIETPPTRPTQRSTVGATLGSLLAVGPDRAAIKRAEKAALQQDRRNGDASEATRRSVEAASNPPVDPAPRLKLEPLALFGSGLPSQGLSSPAEAERLSQPSASVGSAPTAQRPTPSTDAAENAVAAAVEQPSSQPPTALNAAVNTADGDDDDDDDDRPLMLQSRAIDFTEDSDEDVPLWQMRGRSGSSVPLWQARASPSFAETKALATAPDEKASALSEAPSTSTSATASTNGGGAAASVSVSLAGISPLLPVPSRSRLSIGFLAPIASRDFAPSADSNPRMRKAAFDTTVAVSRAGTLACLGNSTLPAIKTEAKLYPAPKPGLEFRSTLSEAKDQIDVVQDVRRLTSKVVGIASSTTRVLGIGPQPQPHQVSLLTVDDGGRRPRIYHLDARPHPQGAFAISSFPNTARDDPTSINFATGGSDGVVNHWRWSSRGGCEVERLHTIHGNVAVTALEHLAVRHNLLVSASQGRVVGFDISQLNLGFTWPTSERIVHLQRTPHPDLILSTCARRDYDQFRLYDVTGRNGPVSRSVISFGWLNNTEGRTPLGRGCFHPTRRSIFAYGSEDGAVRVWDMRKARDPLLVQQVGDEPICDVVWKGDGGGEGAAVEDVIFAGTPRGIRTVELGIERR